jgi:glycerol-3-phosphate acyltransferase PlsY
LSDLLSHPPAPLIIALAAGYILGALPLAERISRLNGVDIFDTGTGLAGASNVLRNVGRVPAAVVMVGDMAKGTLAVIVGHLLGLEGVWVLAPASAAIAGHWKSVFSGFRGGDGLAVLGGITIAVIPSYGVISVMVGGLVALGGKVFPYTSLLSVVSAFLALVSLSLAYYGDTAITLGIGIMACVVLSYAVLGHARRNRTGEWSAEGEPTDLPETDSAV